MTAESDDETAAPPGAGGGVPDRRRTPLLAWVAAAAVLVLLGGLILRGVEMGQFHSALGAAFYAVLVTVVLSVLAGANARSLRSP